MPMPSLEFQGMLLNVLSRNGGVKAKGFVREHLW